MKNIVISGSMQFLEDMKKYSTPIEQKGFRAILPEEDDWDSIKPEEINAYKKWFLKGILMQLQMIIHMQYLLLIISRKEFKII